MVNVLFVELADSTVCVVPAAQIASLGIDRDVIDAGARVADLDQLLGAPGAHPANPPRVLLVRQGDRTTFFRTSSGLQLGEIDEDCFFNLPSVMRTNVCRPWVRGLVTYTADALGVWLDVHELADALWSSGDPS